MVFLIRFLIALEKLLRRGVPVAVGDNLYPFPLGFL